MKPLLDAVLFLAWVSAYLMAVAFAARYRRAKAHPPSDPAQSDYRADRDMGLRIAMLVLGLLLCYLTYLAATGISHLF
ncbi:MAG TPA: hypothetical protein VLM91_06710 [Candidatus Methylomirabilis sp.]|nr:hypothetical protein [Candidatus Methylomirabilis sp.]